MIAFRRIKRYGRKDFGYYRFFKTEGFIQFPLGSLGDTLLFFAMIKNGALVLASFIRKLTLGVSWVNIAPESV